MAGLTGVILPVDSYPEFNNIERTSGSGPSGSGPSVPTSSSMDTGAKVSTSPQGKGVGVFAIGASGENGMRMDQIKDPKVINLQR